MRALLTLVAAAVLSAAPALATTLTLRDGTRITCTVKSYDSAARTLYIVTQEGKDASYTLDQLDGRSAYLINASSVPKDDAGKQFQVANFARDVGLFAHAARRYREAVQLDPSLEAAVGVEMTKLRRAAAETCVRNARAAAAKNDIAEAERWLKVLIEKLPEEPEAAQAAAILEQHYSKERAAKVAAADAKASDALRKDVEVAKKRYQEMTESSKKGLQAGSNSQAERLFRSAISDGKAVLKEIDGIERKYKKDAAVSEQAANYRKLVTDQLIEVQLSLASQLATRSDYQGAQREVNAALALDPKNEQALSMRARIEDYSSRGWGWRW